MPPGPERRPRRGAGGRGARPAGSAAAAPIVQLKVTLRYLRPPVWRRLEAPGNLTLGQLHDVLQEAMGWTNTHLHRFVVGTTSYGRPHPDNPGLASDASVTLAEVARGRKRFLYEYDFGDSWEHDTLVEKVGPPSPGVAYPRCVAGARACPPEDCGGPHGYLEFLRAIADPGHPEHRDMLEWVGGRFDPEAFDLEETNRALGRFGPARGWRPRPR